MHVLNAGILKKLQEMTRSSGIKHLGLDTPPVDHSLIVAIAAKSLNRSKYTNMAEGEC